MDYTEIIEREAFRRYPIVEDDCYENETLRKGFIEGAEYYKQITEIEKLSAKIETCETILSSYQLTKSNKQSLRQVIKAEKKVLDGLINELKIKP